MTSRSKKFTLIGIIALILIVAAILCFFLSYKKYTGYQAVFLTNNQVYFGKLSYNRHQAHLSDVYYIQLQGQATSTASDLNLVKLGTELHAPQDSMDINPDQILFIENLKDDSPVISAINNFKRGQGQ